MQTYTIKVLTDDDVLSGEDVAEQVEQIPEVIEAVLVRVENGDTTSLDVLRGLDDAKADELRERIAVRLDEAEWPGVAARVRANMSANAILGHLYAIGESDSTAAQIIHDWIKEGIA